MAVPVAPTALVATPATTSVSIAFTLDVQDPVVTDIEYRIGAGAWVSAATATSPVAITGLTNNTQYSVTLRAVNLDGNGAASTAVVFYTVDDPADNKDGFNLPTVFANAGAAVGNLDFADPDD